MDTLRGPEFHSTGWQRVATIARVSGRVSVRNHNILIGVTRMVVAELSPKVGVGFGEPYPRYSVTVAKQNPMDEYINTAIIDSDHLRTIDGHLLLEFGRSQLTNEGDALAISQTGLLYPTYLTPRVAWSPGPNRPIPIEVGIQDYFDKIV